MDSFKCVLVGDENVGKSSLIHRAYRSDFSEEKLLSNIDEAFIEIIGDDRTINLSLVDTKSHPYQDRLRPLAYRNSDVFLLCFSLDSRQSLSNAVDKWCSEVRCYCPDTPVMLVGTKSDIGDYSEDMSRQDCLDLVKIIGAYCYLECSSLNGSGVKEVFKKAVEVILYDKSRPMNKRKKYPTCCEIS